MANEKVSQMIPLTAAELASDDVFLVVDTSIKQSKKISTLDLLAYFESTGSFNAVTSTTSISASHVPGSGVEGIVLSASHANFSDTASFALNVAGASNIITGSLIPITSSYSKTSSFLLLDAGGSVNGTASFALTSSFVNLSKSSSFLIYNAGLNNGTSSYATASGRSDTSSFNISSSHAIFSDTSSISITSSFCQSSSVTITSSFLINNYNPIKAWATITWSLGVQYPQIYQNFNIASCSYLTQFPQIGNNTYFILPTTWSQFSVTFTNSVPTTNYTLIGTGCQPFGNPEPAWVTFHPVYSNRTINGFTMSIATQGTNDWYTALSASYPNGENAYISFQILGL